MKEEKFNLLLQKVNILKTNKLVGKYYNIHWEIFVNNGDGYKKIIENFIENFTCKSDTLYLNDEIVHFSSYAIPDERLKSILVVTSFDKNIKSIEKNKLLITNESLIFPFESCDKIENGVYLLKDLPLFSDIFDFFINEII